MKFIRLAVAAVCILLSCTERQNPVLEYFENSEIQYEGDMQRQNIIDALNDVLHLPEHELKFRKYRDYQGKKDQWDLPTLIERHFVPLNPEASLGDHLYRDIRTGRMKKKITSILEQLESDK